MVVGGDSKNVLERAAEVFRKETGRPLGTVPPKWRDHWRDFVEGCGPEMAVQAIGLWAADAGTNVEGVKFPICIFLSQAQDWVALAKECAKKESAVPPAEELVEWHGVKLTRWEIDYLERRLAHDQKLIEEREARDRAMECDFSDWDESGNYNPVVDVVNGVPVRESERPKGVL